MSSDTTSEFCLSMQDENALLMTGVKAYSSYCLVRMKFIISCHFARCRI